MLDRYWFGGVDRISPEAPVPVVAVSTIEDQLGGAANVARNLVALGAGVDLLSVVGADEAGERIQQLLKSEGVNPGIRVDATATTTIKLRVIAQHQQLIRLDFEQSPDHEVLLEVLDDYQQRLEQADIVVLSDYGKGGLLHIDKMIQMARAQNIPILVDPKGKDFSRYQGATLLTPNRKELIEAWGEWESEEQLQALATDLIEALQLEAMLLTRSEEGMTLFRKAGASSHQPTHAREVFDVSGAGDTVISALAVAIGAGLTDDQAIHLATAAAGIVVGKLGVATASLAEIRDVSIET
ncbi:MAG: D-glycero-beta-D-manno-heptose-7-phosphate kinase [Gammaproteobacteria bacterium]|nr:MAG: D-glycero-beta-D-manno-heptose-7-phosphate kinase [Gammaproteobacteria bacterium]RLA15901.1 MAG: D-glycero-beta-D-manno-heptose-7-phosphate kinase [Gammaproteobacteria bacterium]RLA17530.1 MAG: D-glycero-beta-D-manno-heptose-7-phosphate kinase [Gammaproteobacteria bacterium]